MSNPFECTCALAWLKETLKTNNLVAGNPKCALPVQLREQAISSLDHLMFGCLGPNSDDQCPGSIINFNEKTRASELIQVEPLVTSSCPKNCSCTTNGVIRCSHGRLTRVPADIPLNVKELYEIRNLIYFNLINIQRIFTF